MADASYGKVLDAMRGLHPELESLSFEYGFLSSSEHEAFRDKVKARVHEFVERYFSADERIPPTRTVQSVPKDPAYHEDVRKLVIRYLSLELANRALGRTPTVH